MLSHDKTPSYYNPIETTMVDDIPLNLRENFRSNQRKVAGHIVTLVEDPQERSDFLEMIGVKPYKSKDIREERKKAKRTTN